MEIEALAQSFLGEGTALVDLTHRLRPGIPVWPTHPIFCQEVVESYDNGDIACNHALAMSEHSGTHIDAPRHFIRGAPTVDALSLDTFFGRMAKIDARQCAPGAALGIEAIAAFEHRHGAIMAGDAVFFHFGWDGFWDEPERFLRDWPGLSREAAQYLLDRQVRMVGCDCLSLDCYGSQDHPAHRLLLSAGIPIGENFARLGEVPPFSFLITLPLPIEGGSGSPLRAVAAFARDGASIPA